MFNYWMCPAGTECILTLEEHGRIQRGEMQAINPGSDISTKEWMASLKRAGIKLPKRKHDFSARPGSTSSG